MNSWTPFDVVVTVFLGTVAYKLAGFLFMLAIAATMDDDESCDSRESKTQGNP